MIVVCYKLLILCCWGRRDAILTLTDGTEALMKHLSQDIVLLGVATRQQIQYTISSLKQ